MPMQITGTWYLYVRPPLGVETDWDALPTIVFRDGRITLCDGSQPDFTNHKGVLRFSFEWSDAVPEHRIANVLIDRGSDGYLQGWRYLSGEAVAAFPDPETELLTDGRLVPLQLIREDRLEAFRTEQQGYDEAIRRMYARAAGEDAKEGTPETVH